MLSAEFKAFASRLIRAPDRLARLSVPIAAWGRIFPKSSLCLYYHMVSDSNVPHLKHYLYPGTTEFEADVAYLEERFGFINYEEILRRRLNCASVRDNAATLTFDDGFSQCHDVVRPILLRHKAECIFFVITDLIDNRVMFHETQASLCIDAIAQKPIEVVQSIVDELGLSTQLLPPPSSSSSDVGDDVTELKMSSLVNWLLNIAPTQIGLLERLSDRLNIDTSTYLAKVQPYLATEQIHRLRNDGFTIGAHSCSHRRLQDLSSSEAEHEIVESCRIVRDLTGQQSIPFAFPYGGRGIDRVWLAEIRKRNDFIGLFFDTEALHRDAPFVVQRIGGEGSPKRPMDHRLRSAWSRRVAWNRD